MVALAPQIFNRISTSNIKGDLFGGVTAAVIALPMALAFGVASGAGAAAGLWGAVLVGLFAALFGGTPTLISEPTGPMTVVMTAVIASFTASDPENGLAMAFTVVMLAGVFQIIFGLCKLGRYITQMPYTVISGFMSGIGIILMILQIGPFLGQAIPKGGVVGTLKCPAGPDQLSPARRGEPCPPHPGHPLVHPRRRQEDRTAPVDRPDSGHRPVPHPAHRRRGRRHGGGDPPHRRHRRRIPRSCICPISNCPSCG